MRRLTLSLGLLFLGGALSTTNAGDMGGLYNASAPKVNASKKPGEWQQFIIKYQAPRYKGGKRIVAARK